MPDDDDEHNRCCLKHGCRSRNISCSIVCGRVQQSGPCESCTEGTNGEFREVIVSRQVGRVVTITFRHNLRREKIEVELSLDEFARVVTGESGVLGAIRRPRRKK